MGSISAQEINDIIYTSLLDDDEQSYEVEVTMDENTTSNKNHGKTTRKIKRRTKEGTGRKF
jgi:hypothetical protein